MNESQVQFANAVKAVHASVIVDAEGYVKLENLLELAQKFPDPQAFLSAVNSLNQLPVRRCWWCETKLWLGLLRVRWVYFLRSKLAASK